MSDSLPPRGLQHARGAVDVRCDVTEPSALQALVLVNLLQGLNVTHEVSAPLLNLTTCFRLHFNHSCFRKVSPK